MTIINIWEYHVKPGRDLEFRRMNGPRGEWYQFFRHSPDFLSTVLVPDGQLHYFTEDRWKSEEGFREYVARNQADYGGLYKQNQEFAERIRHLGWTRVPRLATNSPKL